VPLGIAAFLRFYSLAEVPGGFSEHPVVHHVDLTFRYLDELFPLAGTGNLGAFRRMGELVVNERLGLMSLLSALGFKLLGVSFLTARLLSATAGCLTVLAAYFFGTQLHHRRLGALFCFLLAVSPWHVAISRYGDLEHVLSPLQLVLALGFYVAAVRHGRLREYLFSASFLALSWFVYPPNLVLPLVVALHLVLLLALRPGFFGRDGWKVGALVLLFLLISYAPLSKMFEAGLLKPGSRTGYSDMERIPVTDTYRNWRMLAAEGKQLFVKVGDPWFTKPGGGLSVTEAALLVPGILFSVGGLLVPSRRWSSSLVLLALPFSGLPAVLAPDESIRRLFLTTTLALLLASLVIARSLELLDQLGFSKRSRLFALILFAAVLGAVNAHVHFDKVRIDSEEGAVYLTEVSKCVRASLGREFTYVYVAHPTETADYHRYIRLAAYEPLQELARRGLKQGDLYEIVFGPDILRILKEPRRIGGRLRILAEESLLRTKEKGVDLPGAIQQAFPQVDEERFGTGGQQVLRSWRIK
jgi:hypothetical protein